MEFSGSVGYTVQYYVLADYQGGHMLWQLAS
jgi:hypothetical protein